jgi:FAD/FMN-containing dehydrogenase
LQVEAGAQIAALQKILGPLGWMFPVTPGTALLTIGGAIANDVHGKNHHAAGTFGHHVLSFVLLRTSGETLMCSPQENADWFAATLGGMGLTGAIQQATLQLRRISHSQLQVKNWRFRNLDEFFTLDAEHTPQHEYSVAWVDCVASGSQLGRGIFSVADHSAAEGMTLPKESKQAARRSVPIAPPFSCINQLSLRAFNTLYFHRPFPLSLPAAQQASMYQWLYPLDSILHWNRLYGRAGFVQFQCAIPPQAARAAVKEMLQTIAQSGQGSFLAVLKNFGEQASLGMLSFPQPGTTLALDFPWLGERTAQLLGRLHAINLAAGGRIYAAKDSHAPAHAMAQGYSRFAEFQRYLDPGLASVMGQRFNLGK